MKKKQTVRLNESQLHRIIKESVKRVLREEEDLDSITDPREKAKVVCYGRDDLLEVAERIANDFGNPSVGEELCGVMADAAVKFLKNIRQNQQWDAVDNF